MHLYFSLNGDSVHLRRLSHCLYKKYNELSLLDYTFYSELCTPQI